jgi:hypothetical protein
MWRPFRMWAMRIHLEGRGVEHPLGVSNPSVLPCAAFWSEPPFCER